MLLLSLKEFNKKAEVLSEGTKSFSIKDSYISNGDLTETLYFISRNGENYYLLQLLSLNDNIVKIKYQY